MDFNQGTKFNVVSSTLDLNATSQAKHCLGVPQQDQSRGAGEEEVLRKKKKNKEEVGEGGRGKLKQEKIEMPSPNPRNQGTMTLSSTYPSFPLSLPTVPSIPGPELLSPLNRKC